MQSKFMTASGVVYDAPAWYYECIIVRTDESKGAEVMAYNGLAPVGEPFWMYKLGKDDPMTARITREPDDPLALEHGVYAALGPHTRLIAYYRPIGP